MNNPAWMGADARPPRVLLLESDPRARALLSYGLGRDGFEVVCVDDAGEAQRTLSAAPVQPTVMVAEASARRALRSGDDPLPLPLILLAREGEALPPPQPGLGADEWIRRPLFIRDVVSLAHLKLKPRKKEGAFDVATETLALPELVRALLSGGRAGTLTLTDDDGKLTFAQGRVVQASFGELRGEPALARLLLFARGNYEVGFGPALAATELEWDLRAYVERTLPKIRHFLAETEKLAPLEERVAVDFKVLAQALPSLPSGVAPVLKLCDGKRTVRQVVIASPLDELVTLRLLSRLKQVGVLKPFAAPLGPSRGMDSLVVVEHESPLWRAAVRAERPDAVGPGSEDVFAVDDEETLLGRAPLPRSWLSGWRWLTLAFVLGAAGFGLGLVLRSGARAESGPDQPPAVSTRFAPNLGDASERYRKGDVGGAARGLEAIVATHPQSAPAWILLGLARFDLGDLLGAAEAADRTVQLDPLEGRAYLLQASVALARKDRESARTSLRRYLDVDPGGPFAREARDLLASLDR